MEIKKITAGPFFTNTYLLIDGNDLLLVDPGLRINNHLDLINKYNLKGILLTHGHIDHIASINLFNTKIYIYKDEEEFLNNNDLNLANYFSLKFDNTNNNQIVVLNDLDEIPFNNYKIKVYHTPGHTRGGVCYYVSNYLFSGDTLFEGSVGRCDFVTGDVEELNNSLKRIMNTFPLDTIVYPGHGDQTTIKQEKENNPFYKKINS